MDHPIKKDQSRFKKIVKGKLRENLSRYVSGREMPVSKGGDVFKVPMPQIEMPKFRFGQNQGQGMGQGDGQPGDPVPGQPGEGKPGEGQEAGQDEGSKSLEVDVTLDELAQILGEQLELPNIEPKGKSSLESDKTRFTSIGTTGPDSLKHFKRSYREALKRQVAIGSYDSKNPSVIPIKADMRFRKADIKTELETSAVVIYMMDVSGSMGEEQKEIVRTQSFWINLWLKSQYKNIETRYIIHDASAKEVDEHTFFRTRESGGTLISSAYHLCHEMMKTDYNSSEWNIYPMHFSDGDNWSGEDTKICLDLLKEHIMPESNVFCYGQVESRYGSGQFYKDLSAFFGEKSEDIILSKIKDRDAIMDSIKDFLGKGK